MRYSNSSLASKVRIMLPSALVSLAGDAQADFKATIQESTVEKTFDDVAVESVDLSPHLALKAPPGTGSVQVQGTQLIVDGVRPEQVRLLLDLAGVRRTGQYTLHPHPETTSSVTVLDWSPKDVVVDIVSSGN